MKIFRSIFVTLLFAVTTFAQTQHYVATLNQTGENAPVANVLENSLTTTPTFVWNDPGRYYIGNQKFPCARTFLYINTMAEIGAPWDRQAGIWCASDGTVYINTGNIYANFDDILNNTPIEIRVYPATVKNEKRSLYNPAYLVPTGEKSMYRRGLNISIETAEIQASSPYRRDSHHAAQRSNGTASNAKMFGS